MASRLRSFHSGVALARLLSLGRWLGCKPAPENAVALLLGLRRNQSHAILRQSQTSPPCNPAYHRSSPVSAALLPHLCSLLLPRLAHVHTPRPKVLLRFSIAGFLLLGETLQTPPPFGKRGAKRPAESKRTLQGESLFLPRLGAVTPLPTGEETIGLPQLSDSCLCCLATEALFDRECTASDGISTGLLPQLCYVERARPCWTACVGSHPSLQTIKSTALHQAFAPTSVSGLLHVP